MKKIVALSIIAAALAVSACNTISGVGRDVSAAGSAVTGGAESAKR
ncbi:entericidin A/B family lipoprotein [Brevundimonas sp. GCM10030266]|nr:entericidin A/B family lipoprotein [Brevundimonas sp.]